MALESLEPMGGQETLVPLVYQAELEQQVHPEDLVSQEAKDQLDLEDFQVTTMYYVT